MVNVNHINDLLMYHFEWKGQIHVDESNGEVSCTGSVNLIPHRHVSQLPVVFDRVGGHFNCDNNHLVNLKGAPRSTGLYFSCRDNPLTSLEGLPVQVGALFWTTWTPNLPLLRLINLDMNSVKLPGSPPQLEQIMSKYLGKGKHHMLNCALELKKAGLEGNASW